VGELFFGIEFSSARIDGDQSHSGKPGRGQITFSLAKKQTFIRGKSKLL
jgi:hypothetical protein